MKTAIKSAILATIFAVTGCQTSGVLETLAIHSAVNGIMEYQRQFPGTPDQPDRSGKWVDASEAPMATKHDCSAFKSLSPAWYDCFYRKK